MKTKREEMLLIITIALGTLLNPLNSSMIAVALSRLQKEFHLTFADASWLISTYYLASAVGQPVMGKLSDAYGRKRIFFFGLSLVAVASMLAPFSPGFWWLIGFRVIQSLGSSALFPAGMGIIRNVITTRQARALGILSLFFHLRRLRSVHRRFPDSFRRLACHFSSQFPVYSSLFSIGP